MQVPGSQVGGSQFGGSIVRFSLVAVLLSSIGCQSGESSTGAAGRGGNSAGTNGSSGTTGSGGILGTAGTGTAGTGTAGTGAAGTGTAGTTGAAGANGTGTAGTTGNPGTAGTSSLGNGGASGATGSAGTGGSPGGVTGHLYAAPTGSGTACASAAPCAITQAQAAARAAAAAMQADTVVELADGTYRLTAPLVFTAADSGTSGHPITWQAATGAHPVISGAQKVTGWTMSDATKGIWKATVPGTFATRQLFVDGKIAIRARQSVTRSDLHFTATGFTFTAAGLSLLNTLAHPEVTDLHAVNSFTDRYSPVQSIANGTATMVQPAWKNNTWGYDTIDSPFRGSSTWLENALEFLDQAGEWFLDKTAGALYYKPASGQDLTTADVELPQLEVVVVVAGTAYDQPAHDLAFKGLTFSHTSWLGPNSTDGYSSQQTGGFIHGTGYAVFEATRPKWWQMPASVQVSVAKNISFVRDRFVALGAGGLGVGNDDNAHFKQLGLGANTISVTGCVFSQIAGGPVVIGGIQATAHHPCGDAVCGANDAGSRMINQNITVTDNLIHDGGIDYRDAAGLLFTYTANAVVAHNELYNLPYSGIASGYGWGVNDAGGSNDYKTRSTGNLYAYQPLFTTATIAKNNQITANYLHDGTQQMNDAGCLYNLSANPQTVISQNYCKGPWPNTNGLYEDEGSRYLTITKNIVTGFGTWAVANANANNNTGDLTVTGNWVSGNGGFGGKNNTVSNNTTVNGSALPADAKAVADVAGLEAAYADLKTTP